MTFDLSRVRFDARQDFLGVVMQQGRVQLDSDWNEWASQLARRLQAGSLDGFNGNVVPRITPDGFLIEATDGALTIGPGRIYVDGLLTENHGNPPNTWEERLAESVGTLGVDYADQPYLPDPPALPQGGTHLVYLDVWQREISAVHQPDLIESAVGVDTTGRLRTVWQVKVLENVGAISCASDDDDIPGWSAETAPSGARLSTATADPPGDPDPCRLPPAAGYRGLENQLYRVQVHSGGPLGTATFKWSRDNGSIATRVTHINPARSRITVESLGRDSRLSFQDGDWVEVTDDWRELNGLPGELRRIQIQPVGGVDSVARTLTFETPLSSGLFPTDGQDATDPERNTLVRRWDQSGPVRRQDGTEHSNLDAPSSGGAILIPPAGTALFLEHGILVSFSLDPEGGEFRSGDHWAIAARSGTASIDLLQQAPPLGIHHHYARLAIVSFPDGETDCRTLWPPLAEGQGCDCSVCVNADDHNIGVATLQQAIDSIKDIGGTICLGIGSFSIREPLNLTNARSLRIRGQGWATLLVGAEPASLLIINDGTGIAVENLSLIGSAINGETTAILASRDVVDLRLDHINVLGLASADSNSVGVGLSGYALGVSINACAIVAESGVARLGSDDGSYLLTADLQVRRTLFFCGQRALSFDGVSLHYGNTAMADNLIVVGNGDAIVATGGVLTGSALRICDNVISSAGNGIRAGVDGLSIEGNTLSGYGSSEEGILIEAGIDPGAIDRLRICGNGISSFERNGIAIHCPVVTATITANRLDSLGLGVMVMAENGTIETLHFSANQCHDVGLAVSQSAAFAALQLTGVGRADILDNVIAGIASTANAAVPPAIFGLRAVAVDQLRVSGNRLFDVGPALAREITAIRVSPPFEDVSIDSNHLDRLGDPSKKVAQVRWWAIDLTPEHLGSPISGLDFLAPASFIVTESSAFLLTATRLKALVIERPARAMIRANHISARSSLTPLCVCEQLDHCLFSENTIRNDDQQPQTGLRPQLGLLQARTLNASNNRLIGAGRLPTLELHPGVDVAIVIGNISTGEIVVQSGNPLPTPIQLTNIIGI